MALGDLNNGQKVLLGKAVSSTVLKKAALEIGHHADFEESIVVRVSGPVKIGAPYEQTIQLKFPWQRLALMLATRVSRQTLDAVLREVSTEEAPGELKEHVEALWKSINVEGKQMCAGKVTAKPSVEVITLQ